MKKAIFFLYFLFPLLASSQNIKLFPKVEISYGANKLRVTDEISNNRYTYTFPTISVRTGLEMRYRHIILYYDTKIWCRKAQTFQFSPEQADFEIGAIYKVSNKISIKLSHSCYHQIKSDDGMNRPGIFGGGDNISISYGY